MTYTRRALSIAAAASILTFGLLLGQTADATQPQSQVAAQLSPGQTYQVQIPDAEWTAAQARGPIQPWPGRTFTATYVNSDDLGGQELCHVFTFGRSATGHAFYGCIPSRWVQD